ncbi:MAG: DNA-binding domain-containing protein [Burkholderiaceae bacterium]|nr:DNA-binding domain-containing protein [Burkholderiaceae bacterium]
MAALSLPSFQAAFARLLMDPPGVGDGSAGAADALPGLRDAPGLAVYRNTVMRSCIDALHANYPTVAQLVGDAWFRAAAAVYVRTHWPARPLLIDYGDRFAAFLAQFPPAASLPYLAAVASLDRSWTESHLAGDAPVLDAAALASALHADAARPDALALCLHPAARWHWFDAVPAFTVWQRHREGRIDDGAIEWQGEGALLTRPAGRVAWRPLSRAGVALIEACAHGVPLAAALEAACAFATPDAAGAQLAQLVCAGAFAALS